jgi:hypothetical protein
MQVSVGTRHNGGDGNRSSYCLVEITEVLIREEVVGKLNRVGETLERRVHEAGVAQIGETGETRVDLSLCVAGHGAVAVRCEWREMYISNTFANRHSWTRGTNKCGWQGWLRCRLSGQREDVVRCLTKTGETAWVELRSGTYDGRKHAYQ